MSYLSIPRLVLRGYPARCFGHSNSPVGRSWALMQNLHTPSDSLRVLVHGGKGRDHRVLQIAESK